MEIEEGDTVRITKGDWVSNHTETVEDVKNNPNDCCDDLIKTDMKRRYYPTSDYMLISKKGEPNTQIDERTFS